MADAFVIALSRRDTIGAVCLVLQGLAPGTQVWLVAPWGLAMTRQMVNLRRLRRVAEHGVLDLHLVSGQVQTRLRARQAGIAAHITLPYSLNRYRRRLPSDGALVERRSQPGAAIRVRRQQQGLTFAGFIAGLLAIALLVAAMGGTAVLFLPTAKIVLQPASRASQASIRVGASTLYREVDYGQAIVPARRVQVSVNGRAEVPATGTAYLANGYASGEVVFSNRTDAPHLIPKGTVVRTSSGVNARFATVRDVEVPGRLYARVNVGIVALEPGITSNVQALTINAVEGDVGFAVDVVNPGATYGGTVGRVTLVSEDDFARLRGKLTAQLREQAYEMLLSELAAGEFIPADSILTLPLTETRDQAAGQQGEIASMSLEVVVRALAVDGNALQDLAGHALLASAGGDEAQLIPDSLRITRSEETELTTDGCRFDVTVRGLVAPTIDISRVQRGVRGKELARAREWLAANLPLARVPEVTVQPSWWQRLPWLPAHLDVQVTVTGA